MGSDSAEFGALRTLGAQVGADPLLIQGPGGNLSIKQAGILWVKASGTWLKDTRDMDIMVPVALAPLLDAVAQENPAAERADRFVVTEHNPRLLQPSIETTLHALLPQTIVIHVHCVDTIALAVQSDAESLLGERLRGLNWIFVPYHRPGLPLALAIKERIKPGIDVLILGNHGLVVAANTVADAARLLDCVTRALMQSPRRVAAPDLEALTMLANGSEYRLPSLAESHAVANDPDGLRVAASGSLYPDHVIFIGQGSVIAGPLDDAASIAARSVADGLPAPVSILFPGKGILMRRDASLGAEAMARCLSDVVARIPQNSRVNYLTEQENAELLNWEAEKYRQQVDRAGVTLHAPSAFHP